MKIVYCLNSISYIGGIERVTIVKANALAELLENEVYIIVTDNKQNTFIHPLSPKVHLIDLDVNYYRDDWKSRWHVLKGIVIKREEHKRKLTTALKKIQPDIVVSVGQAEKYFLPSIQGNWKKIRELHYEKNYRKRIADTFLQKISAYLSDWYDYKIKIKQYDKIVVLTQEDKLKNWKGYNNVVAIPNPISFISEHSATLEEKKIISVGRLTRQKNYSSMIRAFREVVDKYPDWTLEIYGDGVERGKLEQLIKDLSLSNNVILKGFTSDVKGEMLKTSIFVLSSIFEGFALVLLEAMQIGLPIVSYACPCGPKDIIKEGEDGFLVQVNDEKTLADRICKLIENKDLRQRMGKLAKENVQRYNIDNIITIWMKNFNTLLNTKH